MKIDIFETLLAMGKALKKNADERNDPFIIIAGKENKAIEAIYCADSEHLLEMYFILTKMFMEHLKNKGYSRTNIGNLTADAFTIVLRDVFMEEELSKYVEFFTQPDNLEDLDVNEIDSDAFPEIIF